MTLLKIYLLVQHGVGLVVFLRARAIYRLLRKFRDDYDKVLPGTGEDDDAEKPRDHSWPKALCLWSDCLDLADDGLYCTGHRPIINPWTVSR